MEASTETKFARPGGSHVRLFHLPCAGAGIFSERDNAFAAAERDAERKEAEKRIEQEQPWK